MIGRETIINNCYNYTVTLSIFNFSNLIQQHLFDYVAAVISCVPLCVEVLSPIALESIAVFLQQDFTIFFCKTSHGLNSLTQYFPMKISLE